MSAPVFNHSYQQSKIKRGPETNHFKFTVTLVSLYHDSCLISFNLNRPLQYTRGNVKSFKMGRTQRKRKKKKIFKEPSDICKVLNLQKAVRMKCPNIKISYFDGLGWGVRCKKEIKEGEILIGLPLHLLITADVPCEVFSVLNLENVSAQCILTIFLIYESHLKEKSKYFEYIDYLPLTFTNPYFCSVEEIQLLPEFLKKEVLYQVALVDNTFNQLKKIINEKCCPHCGKLLKSVFTKKKFCWAWFCVNTRSVFYQNEKLAASMALAPFLDLFNHSNDAITQTHIDFENRLYILKSCTRFKKFNQVFIKYGNHSNVKLYLEYGFILDDFSNDSVMFSFEEILDSVRESNSNFREITKLKFKFIQSNKLNQNLFKNTEFSWNLKGLIYVLTTEDENISLLQSKTYSNSFTLNEKNVVQRIGQIAAEKKLKQLKGSIIKMEAIQNCSPSFEIAKSLVKMYMRLLQ